MFRPGVRLDPRRVRDNRREDRNPERNSRRRARRRQLGLRERTRWVESKFDQARARANMDVGEKVGLRNRARARAILEGPPQVEQQAKTRSVPDGPPQVDQQVRYRRRPPQVDQIVKFRPAKSGGQRRSKGKVIKGGAPIPAGLPGAAIAVGRSIVRGLRGSPITGPTRIARMSSAAAGPVAGSLKRPSSKPAPRRRGGSGGSRLS